MITLHICLLEELQLSHVRVPILRTILSQPSFLTDLHKTVVNTTTPPENVAEDDGWQLVHPEILPPIDPVDAPSMPNRRNPVRERRPTNFLNKSGLKRRSKSYN